MTRPSAGQAPRVELVDAEEGSEEARLALAEVTSRRGGVVPNVFRAMASRPDLMQAVAHVGALVRFESSLHPHERELIVLSVAHDLRCSYEWTHHLRAAKQLGLDPSEAIELLSEPRDERLAAILSVVRSVTRGEEVDDEQVGTLRRLTGDEGVVDVLVTTGYYVLLARFIEGVGVPLEAGVEARPFPDQEE